MTNLQDYLSSGMEFSLQQCYHATTMGEYLLRVKDRNDIDRFAPSWWNMEPAWVFDNPEKTKATLEEVWPKLQTFFPRTMQVIAQVGYPAHKDGVVIAKESKTDLTNYYLFMCKCAHDGNNPIPQLIEAYSKMEANLSATIVMLVQKRTEILAAIREYFLQEYLQYKFPSIGTASAEYDEF